MSALVRISRRLAKRCDALSFGAPVTHVYDPLVYARAPHEAYLRRYGAGTKRVLFLGMNPGPFGMAQTGVPFGDVSAVRQFLNIEGTVERPSPEHPKRPVRGFDCPRSEVSGARLWGWVRQRFASADAFFERCFVSNYCPLMFIADPARNVTPDKLARAEREALHAVCDDALRELVAELKPEWVIGIGGFAEKRARLALPAHSPDRIASILHPSPASPAANRGWAQAVEAQLEALDLGLH